VVPALLLLREQINSDAPGSPEEPQKVLKLQESLSERDRERKKSGIEESFKDSHINEQVQTEN